MHTSARYVVAGSRKASAAGIDGLDHGYGSCTKETPPVPHNDFCACSRILVRTRYSFILVYRRAELSFTRTGNSGAGTGRPGREAFLVYEFHYFIPFALNYLQRTCVFLQARPWDPMPATMPEINAFKPCYRAPCFRED